MLCFHFSFSLVHPPEHSHTHTHPSAISAPAGNCLSSPPGLWMIYPSYGHPSFPPSVLVICLRPLQSLIHPSLCPFLPPCPLNAPLGPSLADSFVRASNPSPTFPLLTQTAYASECLLTASSLCPYTDALIRHSRWTHLPQLYYLFRWNSPRSICLN